MNHTDSVSTCPACQALSRQPCEVKPHPSMILQKIVLPEAYGGNIERQYGCADCGAVWLRRTDKLGVDKEFQMLS